MPKEPLRKKLYDIVSSIKFDNFIVGCILVNIQCMALAYDGSPKSYKVFVDYQNYFFTGVFLLATLVKIYVYSFRGYFKSSWNIFDSFIISFNLISLFINEFQILLYYKIGTEMGMIARVLKVVRLLKVMRRLQGLQKIINSLLLSLPSILNVFALSMLIVFIYSILGCFLFKGIRTGLVLNDTYNFNNFHSSIIVLLKICTREDWVHVMVDISKVPPDCTPGQTCGSCNARAVPTVPFDPLSRAVPLSRCPVCPAQLHDAAQYCTAPHCCPNAPLARPRKQTSAFRSC